MNIPEIGNWLMPKDGRWPGMVVAVLPSGKQCILARRLPPHYRVTETVHAVSDLKGPMTGVVAARPQQSSPEK
jgi:hypothetical protein